MPVASLTSHYNCHLNKLWRFEYLEYLIYYPYEAEKSQVGEKERAKGRLGDLRCWDALICVLNVEGKFLTLKQFKNIFYKLNKRANSFYNPHLSLLISYSFQRF